MPLALALLMVPTGFGTAPTGPGMSPSLPTAIGGAAAPEPDLSVSPVAAWVADGDSTSFAASWGPVAPTCTLTPAWFRWFLNSTSPEGILGTGNASVVNFTGMARTTGTTPVGVYAAATETCGNRTRGVFATASARVTTVAPLVVDNLTLAPLLLPAFGEARLAGLVEGGVAPYQVDVDWGDDNRSDLSLAGPGPFELAHAFSGGTFAPEVAVADSSGLRWNDTVPEPVQAGHPTAFALAPSEPAAEVGRSVRFVSVGGPATANESVGIAACGTMAFGPATSSVTVTCEPVVPGPLPAMIAAVGDGQDWSDPVRLAEPVAPALSLSVTPVSTGGEEGRPSTFEVNVTGGVPPFEVVASFEGLPVPGGGMLPGDGVTLLTATPGAAGLASLSVDVTDADGVEMDAVATPVLVAPALEVGLTTSTSPAVLSAEVALVGTLTGGEGLVAWVLASAPTPVAGGTPAGLSPAGTEFGWSGSYATEGGGTLQWVGVDAAGAVVESETPVALVAPLLGQVAVTAIDPPAGPALNVSVDLNGGAPPFDVYVNISGNASWNATDPADGVFSTEVPVDRTGTTVVSVVVTDSLGGRVIERTEVVAFGTIAAPAPAGPTTSAPASAVGAGVAVVLGGIGLLLYVRHRRRPAPTPTRPPDPEKVLEGILTPSDGADRVTVELLAEEAGVPLEVVRSTLSQLIAAGRVRSEVSPDGMEVLAWSTLPRP